MIRQSELFHGFNVKINSTTEILSMERLGLASQPLTPL
jgi:hypothetical protein